MFYWSKLIFVINENTKKASLGCCDWSAKMVRNSAQPRPPAQGQVYVTQSGVATRKTCVAVPPEHLARAISLYLCPD